MSTKRRSILLTALIVSALTACNLPQATPEPPSGPNAAFTAAAMTVAAQLTAIVQPPAALTPSVTSTSASASAPTQTPTPQPASVATSTSALTPTPTLICDQAQFVTDVSVPDDTSFSAGASFTKTWRIKNTGTCAWSPSYTLVFASGSSMGGPSTVGLTGIVNPGETVDISVNLTAPAASGDYTGYWKLRNTAGVTFTSVYVKISVGDTGPFAVIHAVFTVTGSCGHWHVSVALTTNKAGTVTYHYIYGDGRTDTLTHPSLVFSGAGTQTVSFDDSSGTTTWVDTYIDSPNHYEFQRANLVCP